MHAAKSFSLAEDPLQNQSFLAKLKEWFRQQSEPLFADAGYALAAGPEEKNPAIECTLDGYDGTISIEYGLLEKALYLEVFDKNGDPELALCEGWTIADSNCRLLGTIKDGKCTVTGLDTFDGRICLVDRENGIRMLHRQEE